jgi:hypothetical protein
VELLLPIEQVKVVVVGVMVVGPELPLEVLEVLMEAELGALGEGALQMAALAVLVQSALSGPVTHVHSHRLTQGIYK